MATPLRAIKLILKFRRTATSPYENQFCLTEEINDDPALIVGAIAKFELAMMLAYELSHKPRTDLIADVEIYTHEPFRAAQIDRLFSRVNIAEFKEAFWPHLDRMRTWCQPESETPSPYEHFFLRQN